MLSFIGGDLNYAKVPETERFEVDGDGFVAIAEFRCKLSAEDMEQFRLNILARKEAETVRDSSITIAACESDLAKIVEVAGTQDSDQPVMQVERVETPPVFLSPFEHSNR